MFAGHNLKTAFFLIFRTKCYSFHTIKDPTTDVTDRRTALAHTPADAGVLRAGRRPALTAAYYCGIFCSGPSVCPSAYVCRPSAI